MNEKQAVQKGYVFTGAYSHDKEEMKARAAAERAKGNKACVMDVPASPLSRGSRGMGYSVYFIESEANKQAQEAKQRAIKVKQTLTKAIIGLSDALDVLKSLDETDDIVAAKEYIQMAAERL